MKLDYKKWLAALTDVEEERSIPQSVILEALKEAMAKAYKKNEELPDIDVVAEMLLSPRWKMMSWKCL